jgi:hypothetical protein
LQLALISTDDVSPCSGARLIRRSPLPVSANILCKLQRQQRAANRTGEQTAQEIPKIKTHAFPPAGCRHKAGSPAAGTWKALLDVWEEINVPTKRNELHMFEIGDKYFLSMFGTASVESWAGER